MQKKNNSGNHGPWIVRCYRQWGRSPPQHLIAEMGRSVTGTNRNE